jgi:hypothetical protein
MVEFNPMQYRTESAAPAIIGWSLVVVLGMCGCGGGNKEKTGDVVGKVTLEGSPITTGSISFISKQGKTGAGELDANGDYKIRKIVVGKYNVVVSPPPLPPPGMPGSVKKAGQAEFPGHPKKYRSDLTSGLEAEVKEGENKFDFDLKAQAANEKGPARSKK